MFGHTLKITSNVLVLPIVQYRPPSILERLSRPDVCHEKHRMLPVLPYLPLICVVPYNEKIGYTGDTGGLRYAGRGL